MFLRSSLMVWVPPSIAAATAAAESTAAARGFLAEINVIVESGIDGIGIERHLGSREHVAFPRLDVGAAATDERHDEQQCVRFHGLDSWHNTVVVAGHGAELDRACFGRR